MGKDLKGKDLGVGIYQQKDEKQKEIDMVADALNVV